MRHHITPRGSHPDGDEEIAEGDAPVSVGLELVREEERREEREEGDGVRREGDLVVGFVGVGVEVDAEDEEDDGDEAADGDLEDGPGQQKGASM